MNNNETTANISIDEFRLVFYKMVVILAQDDKISFPEFASMLCACDCVVRMFKSAKTADDVEKIVNIARDCPFVKHLIANSDKVEKEFDKKFNKHKEEMESLKDVTNTLDSLLKKLFK